MGGVLISVEPLEAELVRFIADYDQRARPFEPFVASLARVLPTRAAASQSEASAGMLPFDGRNPPG